MIKIVVMKLSINDIHYSQDTVRDCFRDGRWLSELCEDLLSKKVTVESLPRIPVYKQGDKWFAMDGNRRLFVLKKLHARGKLDSDVIPVTLGYKGKVIQQPLGGKVSIRGDVTIETVIDNMIRDFEKFGYSKQKRRERNRPSGLSAAAAQRLSWSDDSDSDCDGVWQFGWQHDDDMWLSDDDDWWR